jgi:peptide/nickel transport system permease protein
MIANGANQLILGEWWSSVFPGIAISLTVFGFAVLGNAMERRYERD